MDNISKNHAFERVKAIIDSLALASRVSRHSGFRLVYFARHDDYEKQVRHLIQESLIDPDSSHKFSSSDIDALVKHFITTASPANFDDDTRDRLRTELPLAWSAIAG